MKMKKEVWFVSAAFVLMILLVACGAQGEAGPQGAVGPQGEVGPAGPMLDFDETGCADCHNDTTVLTGVQTAYEESLHATGSSYARGSSASCAGCHSGGAFSERIALGLNPTEVEAGDPNPTRQECRTCHEIHVTYTGDDYALETIDPVALYALGDQVFDGGDGNLCVSCHQPRRDFPAAVDGMVEITSTHWGPHHGPQSAMLLGLGGGGAVEGSPSKHATEVENTCVDCHMGENQRHTFEPEVAACMECHDDVENFDLNGVQTEVQAMLDELEVFLVGEGLLDEEGHPAVQSVPEEFAAALWNWIYIAHEDKSLGVHNPSYTLDLLEISLATFQ